MIAAFEAAGGPVKITSGISDPLIDPFGNQPICADFIGGAQTKWLMKRVIRRRWGDARAALGELRGRVLA